jgi:hypothetical protein
MTNPLSKNKIKIRVGFYEFSDKSHRNWTLIITRGEKNRSWSSVDNNNLLYYYRVQSSFFDSLVRNGKNPLNLGSSIPWAAARLQNLGPVFSPRPLPNGLGSKSGGHEQVSPVRIDFITRKKGYWTGKKDTIPAIKISNFSCNKVENKIQSCFKISRLKAQSSKNAKVFLFFTIGQSLLWIHN